MRVVTNDRVIPDPAADRSAAQVIVRTNLGRVDIEKLQTQGLQAIENPVYDGRVAGDDPKSCDAAIDRDLDVFELLAQPGGHLALGADVEDSLAHDVGSAWANATVAVSIARRGFLPGEPAPWVQAVRTELERTALRGYDCLTWVWTTRGNGVMATAMAQQAVDVAPLHEPAWRALMTAQAEFGSRADAVRTYTRCRELLSAELGVPPDKATVQLYERLVTE